MAISAEDRQALRQLRAALEAKRAANARTVKRRLRRKRALARHHRAGADGS